MGLFKQVITRSPNQWMLLARCSVSRLLIPKEARYARHKASVALGLWAIGKAGSRFEHLHEQAAKRLSREATALDCPVQCLEAEVVHLRISRTCVQDQGTHSVQRLVGHPRERRRGIRHRVRWRAVHDDAGHAQGWRTCRSGLVVMVTVWGSCKESVCRSGWMVQLLTLGLKDGRTRCG